MLDATAQDRNTDANSLDSRNSFAESRLGVEWKFWGRRTIALSGLLMKSISRTSICIARRELLREAFSKLSYRVARI